MIHGLTQQEKQGSVGRVLIQVWKGARKQPKMAGKDLNQKFRISTQDRTAALFLRKIFGEPDENGDFYSEQLNIYLAYDDVERTFYAAMKSFSKTEIEGKEVTNLECDRRYIIRRCETYKDEKGNSYSRNNTDHIPCPMEGKSLAQGCQHGCSGQARFVFYVKEMFDNDLIYPCSLTTSAKESDIIELSQKLASYQQEIGSLTESPFPCPNTRHHIPFILTRTLVNIRRPVMEKEGKGYLRTSKKAKGTTYALQLIINPAWMQSLRQWEVIKSMENYQIAPSRSAIAGLLGAGQELLQGEVVETSDFAGKDKWVEKIRGLQHQLAQLREESGLDVYESQTIFDDWGKEQLTELGKHLAEAIKEEQKTTVLDF